MNQLVFVDTSAFYAIKDLDDAHHREAIDFFVDFTGRFITTNFVVTETITLTLYKLGHETARELGEGYGHKNMPTSSTSHKPTNALPGRYLSGMTTKSSVSPTVPVLPLWNGWACCTHSPLTSTLSRQANSPASLAFNLRAIPIPPPIAC
jgi:hypothetical protein